MIEALITFLALIGIVAIDATGDANKKGWHYTSGDLLIVLMPIVALLTIMNGYDYMDILKISIAYVMARLAFFNPIWNWARGVEWCYFGFTKKWDKLNRWFKQPFGMLQGVYIIAGSLIGLELLGFFNVFNK